MVISDIGGRRIKIGVNCRALPWGISSLRSITGERLDGGRMHLLAQTRLIQALVYPSHRQILAQAPQEM